MRGTSQRTCSGWWRLRWWRRSWWHATTSLHTLATAAADCVDARPPPVAKAKKSALEEWSGEILGPWGELLAPWMAGALCKCGLDIVDSGVCSMGDGQADKVGINSLPRARITPTKGETPAVAHSVGGSRRSSGGSSSKVMHSKTKAPQGKRPTMPCSFLCGKNQGDIGQENEEELMRLAYRDGSGNCGWYAERVWGTISHRHKLRSEFH